MRYLNFSWIVPGKLAGHSAPKSRQDLAYLKQQGILALIRMADEDKARITDTQVAAQGMSDCHEPVPDFSAPTPEQIEKMVGFIQQSLEDNRPVGVSCGAGLGRTGTVLACYLISQGLDADAAMREVRGKRPGSIETGEQEEVVRKFAASRAIQQG